MDLDLIRKAAEKLEKAVKAAKELGYENADCVLTPEVLAPLAQGEGWSASRACQTAIHCWSTLEFH
ncbi:hypothetical protein [Dyella jiangningensis]